MRYASVYIGFGLLLLLGAPLRAQEQEPARDPILIELFVSQACGACAEASDVVSRVAGISDALVLTYPVDYWDYRGWKDTMARPEHGKRQEAYRRTLANSRRYTPQAVVQGAIDVRGDAEDDLYLALDAAPVGRVRVLRAEMVGDDVIVRLGQSQIDEEVEIWVAPFYPGESAVDVKAGENRGRTMRFLNVVHGLTFGGLWGALGDRGGATWCAIIVQQKNNGRILAVASIDAQG